MKNRIKIIRAEQNLTQQALADMMGISRVTLSMIETERSVPDGNTIALLVKALGVPANHIFFGLDVVYKQ